MQARGEKRVEINVFTGEISGVHRYCRKVICVLGLKPNKHFDCCGVIYLKEENLISFLTIIGSKDSFRISHFKFGNFFVFNYLYTHGLCRTRQL